MMVSQWNFFNSPYVQSTGSYISNAWATLPGGLATDEHNDDHTGNLRTAKDSAVLSVSKKMQAESKTMSRKVPPPLLPLLVPPVAPKLPQAPKLPPFPLTPAPTINPQTLPQEPPLPSPELEEPQLCFAFSQSLHSPHSQGRTQASMSWLVNLSMNSINLAASRSPESRVTLFLSLKDSYAEQASQIKVRECKLRSDKLRRRVWGTATSSAGTSALEVFAAQNNICSNTVKTIFGATRFACCSLRSFPTSK